MSRTVTIEAPRTTEVAVEKKPPTIREIRNSIPEHLFKPSALRSSAHAVFDCTVALVIAVAAYKAIPLVSYWPLRWALWALYGYIEGLVFTGIWIVAHECGHGGLFHTNFANDLVGYTLHTSLLVPYFPWKYTHARHHRYTGHMEKDTAFVPHRAGETSIGSKIAEMLGHSEDAPLYMLGGLIMHQLLGWQAYLLFYVSAGKGSTPKQLEGTSWAGSHFDPMAHLWTPSQRPFVFLSTVGLGAVMFALYQLSGVIGMTNVLLLYGVPYLWVNNWLGMSNSWEFEAVRAVTN
jgi:omega-6 fatty acid desaturase (delta-12 desaturase)